MLSRRVYDIFSPRRFCIRCCKEGVFCAVRGRTEDSGTHSDRRFEWVVLEIYSDFSGYPAGKR
jgi:hypothetical protein